MVIMEFITWWYTRGYAKLIQTLSRRLQRIAQTFSVPLLIRTLFAPWRRIITYGGTSFIDGLKAMLDNFISRVVGAGVRIIVIGVAGVSMLAVTLIGLILMVLWPLAPILAVGLIVRGVLPW